MKKPLFIIILATFIIVATPSAQLRASDYCLYYNQPPPPTAHVNKLDTAYTQPSFLPQEANIKKVSPIISQNFDDTHHKFFLNIFVGMWLLGLLIYCLSCLWKKLAAAGLWILIITIIGLIIFGSPEAIPIISAFLCLPVLYLAARNASDKIILSRLFSILAFIMCIIPLVYLQQML